MMPEYNNAGLFPSYYRTPPVEATHIQPHVPVDTMAPPPYTEVTIATCCHGDSVDFFS